MKKFISILLAALLLCSLCGVHALAEGEEPWGVYTMIDMNDGETENAAELLAMMASLGMSPTLTINEDGSAVMDFFGETSEVTFDFESMTAGANGEFIPFTLEDGVLILENDGTSMTFSKQGLAKKTGVGVFDYYELIEFVDEEGIDYSEDFALMREEGYALNLKVFESGDAQLDNLSEITELFFDFENMTVTAPGTDELQPFTLEDGILTVGAEDGEHMRFELSDPGWAGDYQVISLASEDEGDLTEQLGMLSALGMAPSLSIDENGDGVLDLFGVQVPLHFDFDALVVTSDEDDTEVPFSYEMGKLSMESDGSYMVFARAVLDENAMTLSDLIGTMG